jgi:hypothetical protein
MPGSDEDSKSNFYIRERGGGGERGSGGGRGGGGGTDGGGGRGRRRRANAL